MSSFDEWYERYERDGGELMLFNSIDLEAAYKAGMLRAAEALCKNCKAEGLNVRCDLCTDVAAIREEANSGGTKGS